MSGSLKKDIGIEDEYDGVSDIDSDANGSDVDVKEENYMDYNPLIDCIKKDDPLGLLSILADDLTRERVQYALKWSCKLAMFNCVLALFRMKMADLFMRDENGDNVLFWACMIGDQASLYVALELIGQACDYDEKPKTATNAVKFNAMEWLVGCVNKDGDTPLHVAAITGSFDLVRLLLDHGANPIKRNRFNQRPCDIGLGYPDKTWMLLRKAARRFEYKLFKQIIKEKEGS